MVELKEGDEIKFTAVADNDSRAQTVFCNYNKMESFALYAAQGTNKFIFDETYTIGDENGDANYYSTTKKRYWPETEALDFVALCNHDKANLTITGAKPTGGSFTVDGVVETQKDFVYAVNPGVTKQSVKNTNGTVRLNFRHALSQIEFKAKNENQDLKIVIKNVKVGHAFKTGTYTLPQTTVTNWVNHNQLGEAQNGAVIEWTAQSGDASYSLASDINVTLTGTSEKALTYEGSDADDADFNNIYKQSMLLLPQTSTTPWDPEVATTPGTYLAVKCLIYNVCDGSEVLLYGGNGGRWAFVPVTFNWEPGKKYVYTFNFTLGGNAGYEDTEDDGEPNNVPVLVPLTVDVTVDDFQPGTVSPNPTPMETN